MQIRSMQSADFPCVWTMFKQIIDEQVYYSYDHTTTRMEIEKSWINEQNLGYVAEIDGVVAGAYIVKPNQPGHGAHIANAAYMVAQEFRGRGIGRLLGEHSLVAAKKAGYRAMQYNMVISTNTSAVQLWQSLGFRIIGTVPEAFLHCQLGYVDAHIMHRKL